MISLCNIRKFRKNPSGMAPAICGSFFFYYGLFMLSFIILDTNLMAQGPDVVQVDVASLNCDFTLQAQLQHPRCFGAADGRITLLGSATDGNNLSFRWLNLSSANNTNEANNLTANTYHVEVSEPNCKDTLSFQLNNPPELQAPFLHKVFCSDGAEVDLLENVTGGTGALSFTAITIFGTEVACGTCPSSIRFFDRNSVVQVDVQDENNCTVSRFVVVEFYPELIVQLNIQDETCEANGQIEVMVSGGSGNYLYGLDADGNFQNANTFSGLTGGTTYQVQVMDAEGCLVEESASLALSPAFAEPEITWTDASCFGNNDGVINVNVLQDNLQITLDSIDPTTPAVDGTIFENVAPGTHTVYIQQGDICTKSYDVIIEQPEQLSLEFDSTSNSGCPGEVEVSLQIEGGTGEYNLFLDGVPTDLNTDFPILSGLTTGLHVVTVQDENGCEETKSLTIEDNDTLDLGTMTFPSCPDENTGSIVIVEAGKLLIGNYTFSLDSMTWQSVNLFEGLAPGEYIAYVQNAEGCVFEVPFIIEAVVPPEIELIVQSISCPGGSDGSANVQITSGNNTTAYTYSIDSINFSSNNVFEHLSAGNYTLYVRDANPCIFTYSFSIEEPDSLIVGFNVQEVSCFGESDGQIEINVLTGGTPPYEYALNNGNFQPDNFFSGLPEGLYVAMVRDSNGCLYLDDITLSDPAGIQANMQIEHSTCGSKNGIVICNPFGGTPPYSFSWNTGDSTAFISGIEAGTYHVTISDAVGCGGSGIALVENIAGPLVLASIDDVGCYGMNNGEIDLSVLEGTAPFQYNWSNGEHTQDLAALSAGSYVVTVIDFNQCSDTKSYTIHEPPPIEMSSQVGLSGDYWFINLIVEGGESPYTYEWSNGETTEDIFNLTSGTYIVTVTDNQGCEDRQEIEVGITASQEPLWARSLKLYPLPTREKLHIEINLPLDHTAFLSLYNASGQLVFPRRALNHRISIIELSALPKGLYLAKIESENSLVYRKVIVN